MEIKDLQANQGKVDLVVEVMEKKEERTFEKFGKSGKVCNAIVKDATGSVTLTLWNEDVDKVKVGDRVHVKNGWCSEFREEKQVSSGKFGEIEVLESSGVEAAVPGTEGQHPGELLTNSPEMLAGQPLIQDEEAPIEEEELVE